MRFLVVVARLLPLTLSFVRDYRRWLFAGGPVERSEAFHERRAARLIATLAALGPTFVKLAQLFAGRADLIPEPYVSSLAQLVDSVPPAPLGRIRAIIASEYGEPVESVFESFDPEPIAAASLGQVYRATLKGGEPVAVKVLRPGVEKLVAKDVVAADRILALVERRWPLPHVRGLRGIVSEFARRVGDEMDFRLEAANAREVRRNFAGMPGVLVPRVHDELVRQRVLVLELMEGERIDRWMVAAQARRDAAHSSSGGNGARAPDEAGAVLAHVIELYMRMMLVDGLFHADPHPGNLMVSPDGELVVLDFGMVVRVPREQRWQLVKTVFAAIRKDADGVVAGFQALGMVEPTASPGVIRDLVVTLLALAEEYTTVPERVELLANEVMSTMYDWPVVLPPDLVYFARTAGLIEGLGVRYDHRFNAISFASPIALRMRVEIMRSLSQDAAALGEPDPVSGAARDVLESLFGGAVGGILGDLAVRALGVPGVGEGVAGLMEAWQRGRAARGAPPNSNLPPGRSNHVTHSLPSAPSPRRAGASVPPPSSHSAANDPLSSVVAIAGGILGTAFDVARRAGEAFTEALNEGVRPVESPRGSGANGNHREEHPPSVRSAHARLLADDEEASTEDYVEVSQEKIAD